MNRYTHDELILCTYAALYDSDQFGGAEAVYRLTGRSLSSIKMKISNMAAMLDDKGVPRNPDISPLTGTPPGQPARETDWETVKTLCAMPKSDLQALCRQIV